MLQVGAGLQSSIGGIAKGSCKTENFQASWHAVGNGDCRAARASWASYCSMQYPVFESLHQVPGACMRGPPDLIGPRKERHQLTHRRSSKCLHQSRMSG